MFNNKFTISAPGRIVLTGEHTATYGRTFVSTSLDRRTTLKFHELPDKKEVIKIYFPKVKLNICISLQEVRRFFYLEDNEKKNPINVLRYVKYFITLNGLWCTFKQRFSLKAFFFLLYTIACERKLNIKPFYIYLTTELPIGAGLGSSTSFAVCLAACFLHWKRLQDGHQFIDFDDEFKKNITSYAKLCEEYIQDYECATVDATVCVYGKVVKSKFCSYNYVEPIKEEQNMTRLNILLIDSNLRQRKCDRAKQVAVLKNTHLYFNFMLNKLNLSAILVHNWLGYIKDITNKSDLREYELQHIYWRNLQTVILQNQTHLCEYTLSNQTFEDICSIAKENGYEGKLTGYRSGFVYILLPPNITNEQINIIKSNISARLIDFAVTSASINCEGVRIDNAFH